MPRETSSPEREARCHGREGSGTPAAVAVPRAFWAGDLIESAARPYIASLRRDAVFHAYVAAYALVGFAVAVMAGVHQKFAPLTYAGMVATSLPQPVALLVACMGIRSLAASAPLQYFRGSLTRMWMGPDALAGLLLFANLLIFMGVFTSLKTMLPDINPFFADPYLAELDRLLHGNDPWVYAVALLPPQLTPVLEVVYFGVWMLLLFAPMLAMLLLPGLKAVRSQYLWTALIMWPLLGNVLAVAAMSGGPVFYDKIVGDHRFGSLLAHLLQHSKYQEFAQAYLWDSYVNGTVGAGVAISAFPSLHLANATLLVLLAGRINRWLTGAALAFCGLILFGSVYLGWHYAVDGYFSIGATILIWKVVGWCGKLRPMTSSEPG
jgi:hypothetical protein